MEAKQVLAALAVADIEASLAWYAKLLGRPADERPMKEAASWTLGGGGGLQLVLDSDRAGKSMATIGITGMDALVAEFASRGIDGRPTAPGDGPYRLLRLPDPDGNILTFAEEQQPA